MTTSTIPSSPTVPDPRDDSARALSVTTVRDDAFEVRRGGRVIGFVQVAGPIYVALLGGVFNTSIEIGQHLSIHRAAFQVGDADGQVPPARR